jgi:hypothetical protein
MNALDKKKIEKLFRALNDELKRDEIRGELYLVGGAVMCIAFAARPSTLDVDAYFIPTSSIRAAARRVAHKLNVNENWLNDGVKGFLSAKGTFDPYIELSHLRVFSASAEYLLAMKCLAMRIGEEFRDIEDIRYLLRHLGVETYAQAIEIISRYYSSDRFPQKTLYALTELLERR